MKYLVRLVVTLAWFSGLATPAVAQDPLSQAKSLYDSASYSEALSILNDIGPDANADVVQVDTYRALCLLALGRAKEAEASLEHLALNRPLYTFDSDASPKLVSMFQDVRRRTLPEAAKQTYQHARESFEKGDMPEASRQFKIVIALADTAPPDAAPMLADLKMLATGFVRLTEPPPAASAAPASPAPAAAPPTTAASATPPPVTTPPARGASPAGSSTPSRPAAGTTSGATPSRGAPASPASASSAQGPVSLSRIYDITDAGVKPPTVIDRPVPSWSRPPALRGFTFQGILNLVIAENGTVMSATMAKSVHVGYDPMLLAAAKRWRFRPATLDGQPVQYRMLMSVTIQP